MVLRAAHPRRIFLQQPQARQRLAGIEQDRAGAGDGVDIAARQRGDTGQMLHRVERGPLGGQHRASLAAEAQQIGAGINPVTILRQPLDLDLRIERAEEGFGDRQAGDNDRLARIHHAGETRVHRDHRGRRDVAVAAEILGQGSANEGLEIEPGQHEAHRPCHQSCANTGWPTSPLPTVCAAISSMRSSGFLAAMRRLSSISTRGSRSRSAR